MTVSAADVKALREATGAGMMDCKKALAEVGGDFDAAKKLLREKGLADVSKRSGRTAGEGLVEARVSDDARRGAIIELCCETDFVAKGDKFGELAGSITERVFDAGGEDVPVALKTELDRLVDEAAIDLREKMEFKRVAVFESETGVVEAYLHKTGGWAKKGVLVEVVADDTDPAVLKNAAHELALHIQFARPSYLTRDEVPEAAVVQEREIAEAKARNEGKPDAIIPKIAEGAVNKYYKENVLLEQPFVKDDKKTVAKWLEAETGGKGHIVRFARFEIGEDGEASPASE